MTIGIRGFAAIIAVAALMVIGVACGNGAEPTSVGGTTPTESDLPTALIVSHGGAVKDYVSLVDNLRAAGATVDPAGTASADFLALEKQLLTVNGEDIQAFEFGSAEEADAAAGGVSATGSSIVTTMADGTQMASMITWVAPQIPHFYKAGKLIVLYVGSDNDVIDALQEAMGPQFAGGEARTQAPPTVGETTPAAPAPAAVSHGGAVKDYVSLVDNLRAAGATVDPAGTESVRTFAPQGQLLTVNGAGISAYEFGSAEEADAGAEGVSASGSSIATTFADGTGIATMVSWVESPHFYKAGKLIVLYVGCDSDVIDVLQETMGPQFAGGAGVGVHGVIVLGHGRCPEGVQPAPAIASGPPLRWTFDGVEYAAVEWRAAINMDDMEVVGTATRNNPEGDTSVELYRPKAGATTDVYIFHPATTVKDREPGGLPPSPARPASWTRLTADIAPPAPAANPTHGSPQPPVLSGAPEPSLKFDGVDYVHSGSAGLPSGESTTFVIGGIEVNVNDLAVVGTTFEGRAGGLKDGLQVYRSSGLVVPGTANAVYTFTPGESHVNPEDGQIFESPATWMRWIAQ